MKRIRKNILFIFVLLVGFTFNVKAENFNYYLSNSNQNYEYVDKNNNKTINVEKGDIVKVVVILDNKENVNGYHLQNGKITVNWDEKVLSLQETNGKLYNDAITDISGLTIGSTSKTINKITFKNITSTGFLKTGKNKVVELQFKVLKNTPATVTKIYQNAGEDSFKCVREDETINCGESLYSELKYNITKSTVNKLTSIKIDNNELEYFNEDTKEYDLIVDSNVTRIKIDVTKKDELSIVSGDTGEKNVSYGINKYVIIVTSESGSANQYVLNVNRIDNRSSDNTLKALAITPGEIIFDANILEYTVNVDNSVDKVTITSSLADVKSKYAIDYRNKEINLVEGSNKVEIKIVAENGEEKTYTLNINRALSSNNSLKSLKVNDEKIPLVENEFIYNVTVENDINEVIVTAVPNDTRATVKLDKTYPLIVGENEINITVVAPSGQEAAYTINVTRKKLLSSDSLLVNIKVTGYNIDFKQDVKVYDLKIKDDVDELEITAIQEDPTAEVIIEGNKRLENGSIIKINVKAEDGTYTRYFINIIKSSSKVSPVIIIILILLLLLAGCIGLIFYRKKKSENKVFNQLDEDHVKPDIKENVETQIKEEIPIQENISTEKKVILDGEYVGIHEEKEKDV